MLRVILDVPKTVNVADAELPDASVTVIAIEPGAAVTGITIALPAGMLPEPSDVMLVRF